MAETIRSVSLQADVYLVDDASDDATAAVAAENGATVLSLHENVGKPAAIYRLVQEEALLDRYDYIAILDDDTVVAPDFVAECLASFREGVVIVTGKTLSRKPRSWRSSLNPLLAARAFAYWRYQVALRRGQSALGVMNCISGSNSMFTADVLRAVIRPDTPYIVDDTFWTMEVQRRKLGRIVYAPRAVAAVCDPTTLRDWYKQNLRWLWGSFQGIHGHKVGRSFTRFDILTLGLMVDWALYVVGQPVFIFALFFFHPGTSWQHYLVVYFAMLGAWTICGAISLRRPSLLLHLPSVVVLDFVYRIIFVHAAIKTWRQPVVSDCRWSSPSRKGAS